jgi:hypothetical protein
MGIEENSLEQSNDLLEELKEVEASATSLISVELYNRRTNKSEKLINNDSDHEYQKGKNIHYRFAFIEKLWISKIVIKTENYSSWDKLEFDWYLDGKVFSSELKIYDGYVFVTINGFIDKFDFKPPKKWSTDPRLLYVKATGFTVDEFIDACKTVAKIDDYKEKILDASRHTIELAEQAKDSIDDLQTQIEEKDQIIQDVEQEVGQAKKDKAELNESLRSLNSQESDLKTRIESLDDSIDGKIKEQKSLNTDIDTKKSDLTKLEDDINMFPSEIAGFVNEGENALRKYYWLAAIPMVVIILVTFSLFSSAVDLTTVLKANENVDILTVMLTRLPYVTVSGMLIAACFQLIKYFVGQMVKINQQRLNLNKISIIANDVSIASSTGLDMNESEKYHARTKLKMELLKEHLKEEISQSYEYNDNQSISRTVRGNDISESSNDD